VDARVREGRGRDRQRRLLIEFVADAEQASVWIGTFTVGGEDEFTPSSREPLARLAPSRAWVLRNIRLILTDAFGLPEADVAQLGPLGPATPPRAAHDTSPKPPPGPPTGAP